MHHYFIVYTHLSKAYKNMIVKAPRKQPAERHIYVSPKNCNTHGVFASPHKPSLLCGQLLWPEETT